MKIVLFTPSLTVHCRVQRIHITHSGQGEATAPQAGVKTMAHTATESAINLAAIRSAWILSALLLRAICEAK